MKINLAPQRSESIISYEVDNEALKVTINDKTEVFDFTGVPNGAMEQIKCEVLETNPIVKAEKIDGELEVTLIRFYSYEEKGLFENG